MIRRPKPNEPLQCMSEISEQKLDHPGLNRGKFWIEQSRVYLFLTRLFLPGVDGERDKLGVVLNKALNSDSICVLKLLIFLQISQSESNKYAVIRLFYQSEMQWSILPKRIIPRIDTKECLPKSPSSEEWWQFPGEPAFQCRSLLGQWKNWNQPQLPIHTAYQI